MLILTIRTDKPEAELGLFEDQKELDYYSWEAHRQLAETIHLKITELLEANDKKLQDIAGIAVFQGPGSFTGLRIGISVANALAHSLNVPIMAGKGDDWIKSAISDLLDNQNDKLVIPEYGAPPKVTEPRK